MPNQSLLKYKLVLMSTTRCAGGGGARCDVHRDGVSEVLGER